MRQSLLAMLPVLVFACFFFNGAPGGVVDTAWAAEEWRIEFNEICGRTGEAATLSTDELDKLVGRCDVLRKKIEKLGPGRSTESKVYLKRLDMCSGLYQYVLRVKEKK